MVDKGYFKCKCGRVQSYADEDDTGGITEEEAKFIGWTKENGEWVCPFCNDKKRVVNGYKKVL